jgi:hypothetical protein
MQRRFHPPSPASHIVAPDQSAGHWVFGAHVTMALVVIVLLTLTLAKMETFLSGDKSLSALQAADLVTKSN